MSTGRKWFGMTSKRRRGKKNATQSAFRKSRIETLEARQVLSNIAPFLEEIAPVTLYSGSPLHIPLDALDDDGDSLSFSVSISNESMTGGGISSEVLDGNRSMKIETNYGDMIFELFEDRAERATERIIMLAESGIYDGLIFHRVIDGFMIQGGDPLGDGSGGSDLPDFDDQFHYDLQHNRGGVLSMAKSGDDTNNSQFFITEGPTRHLDYNHTIFGQLVEGESVRETISGVDTKLNDGDSSNDQDADAAKPFADVVMESVEIFYDDENGVLMLSAPESSYGSADITVTVNDGNSGTYSRTFTVTVEPDVTPDLPAGEIERFNSNPYLADIDPIITTANTEAAIELQALDVDGPMVINDGSGGTFSLDARYYDQYLMDNWIDQYYISPNDLTLIAHPDLDYEVNTTSGAMTVTPSNDLVGVHPVMVAVGSWVTWNTYDNPVYSLGLDTQLVPVVIQPDTLTAKCKLEMSIVQTPTATDAYSEIDQLPNNVDWMDEWESFSVEIWASTENNPDEFGIHTAAFDLTYNTDYYTATGIEYGNVFSSNRTGEINDNLGRVNNIGGKTPMYALSNLPGTQAQDPADIEKFGDDKPVLVARVNFVPNTSGGVPMNATSGYITATDLGLSIQGASVALNVGDPVSLTIVEPDVKVWPMMYDYTDNGSVGLDDLAYFAAAYGQNVGSQEPLTWKMDYDHSGTVNLGDLAYFAANYRHALGDGNATAYPAGFPENWEPPATSATSAAVQAAAMTAQQTGQSLDDGSPINDLDDDASDDAQSAYALFQSQNDSGSDSRSTDESVAIVDLLMRMEVF